MTAQQPHERVFNGLTDRSEQVYPYANASTSFSHSPRLAKDGNEDRHEKRAPLPTLNLGALNQLPSAADLFVKSLPGLPDLSTHPTHPLQIYAGNIPSYPGEDQGGGKGATGKDAMLYFMMARARRSAGKQRVILWFNGGPGCSSFDGSLMEVGPFRTVGANKSGTNKVELELVEGGWEEFATVVFIDQPPGTGYSYVPTNGYLHDLGQGSEHLITFLQNFYHIFPELEGLDTYLAGESYAGQYIPYFAKGLLETNKLPKFKLSGLAIGNGWIDPFEQYPAYAQFAYDKKLIARDSAAATVMENALVNCQNAIDDLKKQGQFPININDCGGVMSAVGEPYVVETNGRKTCMNVYDVRLVDDWPACGMNWPPDLPDVYDFLRRPDVVTALHADKKETAWVECDGKVGAELHNFKSPASVTLLPQILEAGIPILMFAGAEDLICNHVGIERICDTVTWAGGTGMGNSTTENWFLNGTQVGTWRTHRNLTYAKLFDSSHMVGFDVPHVTNDMILRFMGVDFSLLPGLAAGSESRIGKSDRVRLGLSTGKKEAGVPLLKGGNSDWEAAYNVGSAFLILLILVSIVAMYFFFKRKNRRRYGGAGGGTGASGGRRRRGRGGGGGGGEVGLPQDEEDEAERVPLGRMDDEYHQPLGGGKGKGKSKGKGKQRYDRVDEQDRDGGYEDRDGDLDLEDGRGETVFALGDEDEDLPRREAK